MNFYYFEIKMNKVFVFIGGSSLEKDFAPCKKSIVENSSLESLTRIQIIALNDFIPKEVLAQRVVKIQGIYGTYYFDNLFGDNSSSSFSLTRYALFNQDFLSQFGVKEQDLVLFCDSDFIWICDLVKEANTLVEFDLLYLHKIDARLLIAESKKENNTQPMYPKKGWTSFFAFRKSFLQLRNIDLDYSTYDQRDGHRLKFVSDNLIKEAGLQFNYIVNKNFNFSQSPKALHYTFGTNRIEHPLAKAIYEHYIK